MAPPARKPKQRNIVFFVLIAVAMFMMIDPFRLFTPAPAPTMVAATKEQGDKFTPAFKADSRVPSELLTQLFQEKQVVLFGNQNLIREELLFLTSVTAQLPSLGVPFLGVDFLLASDQPAIDALLAQATFDPQAARSLLFRRLPLWGYEEYVQVIQASWQAHQGTLGSAQPFRLIGLGMSLDYTSLKDQEDFKNVEKMKQVFAQGVPDQRSAEVVVKTLGSVTDKKVAKMAIFGPRASSYLRFQDRSFAQELAKYGLPDAKRLGNYLAEALGIEACASVWMHSPWDYKKSPNRVTFPADSVWDNVLRETRTYELGKTVAFDLRTSVLGQATTLFSDFGLTAETQKTQAPLLRDLADVYVVFGPLNRLHSLTPIPDFITPANLDQANRLLPATMGAADSAPQMNESIRRLAEDYQKLLNSFP